MKLKRVILFAGICAIALSGCSQVIGKNKADNTQATASVEDVGCMPFTEVSKFIRMSQEIYSDDNGALWGKKLESRIMVIDSESGKFIASENNADNSLEPKDDYYVGKLPDGIIVANSTIQYGGKSWAQISYTNNIYSKDRMMCTYLHEIFHNNQESLGHIASVLASTDETKMEMGYDNSHMDEMDARILIKLEWAALFKALESDGEERQRAVKAALVFREKRREIYNKASDENSFEIEEGLPDYTAFKLYYKERDKLMKALKESWDIMLNEERTPSYIRSFGYHSGTCYAFLLDESKMEWKSNVKPGCDLGELLKQAYNISDIDTDWELIRDEYGYEKIKQVELERKAKNDVKIDELKAKFVDGHVLILKLDQVNLGFNPNKIWNIPEYGNVYEEAQVICKQGTINVDQVLINDKDEAFLPADNMSIKGNEILGDGWNVLLSEGYEIVESENGNYKVVEKKA